MCSYRSRSLCPLHSWSVTWPVRRIQAAGSHHRTGPETCRLVCSSDCPPVWSTWRWSPDKWCTCPLGLSLDPTRYLWIMHWGGAQVNRASSYSQNNRMWQTYKMCLAQAEGPEQKIEMSTCLWASSCETEWEWAFEYGDIFAVQLGSSEYIYVHNRTYFMLNLHLVNWEMAKKQLCAMYLEGRCIIWDEATDWNCQFLLDR